MWTSPSCSQARASMDCVTPEYLTWDFEDWGSLTPPHSEQDQVQTLRGCDHREQGALPRMSSKGKQS